MREFRTDNTDGYSQSQLDALNDELSAKLKFDGIDVDSDNYHETVKQFSDEVSRR